MKMFALLTDQETAARETALCEKCLKATENKEYAREQGHQTDDVPADQEFVDCSGNIALECCICGYES